MKNKKVLEELLVIFGNPKKDWMGYQISKSNYISYHHILEKRNGGIESVDNGAILTRTSHRLLHIIEQYNFDLYLKWQLLFMEINNSREPINEYYAFKILELKKETKDFFISLNNYKFNSFTL